MKLKTLSLLKYRGIYVVIAFVILFLTMNSWWYFLLTPFYFWYLFKNHDDILKIIIGILLLYGVRVIIFNNHLIKENAQYNITVIKDVKLGDYSSFTGKYEKQYIKVYIKNSLPVRPGESLLCEGKIEKPINNTTPKLFNYKNYLQAQNIKVIFVMDSCKIVDHKWNINIISYNINDYIDHHFKYSNNYIKTFVLADKSGFDKNLRTEINTVGISHLFAVSGLHIALIVMTFIAILKTFKLPEIVIEGIIMLFLIGYMIITSFSPSVTRASLMFILLVFNKRFNIKTSSIDVLSFIFVILVFIKPYYFYNVGFTLSFLVTFLILLSNKLLKTNNKLKQLIILTVISFLGTIPLILSLNYQINILSLIFNLFFLGYVTYIILPLGYITFLLPFLDKIYYQFIKIFEWLLHLSSQLDFFILKIYFENPIIIIIYYSLFFYLLINYESKKQLKKVIIYLGVFFIIVWNIPHYNPFQKVTFLDIYGDSTIITDSFDQCNIIIDTGEVDEYDTLVNYLKTNNIKRIDYLIITHYHSDHYGETNDLLNNFKIINLVNRENITQFPGLINCGKISFYLYPNEKTYRNENNRSIILSLFISGKHYLFTGDIEAAREDAFIKNYTLDVDYLKVAHHGSITSSTPSFIDAINPEEVFIIVSRNNRNNHPSDIVVSRYEKKGIKVYRTDQDGTIIVYYIFTKEFKKIHRP